MKEIEGQWLKEPELNTLWVGDLVEHEGPILVLLADAREAGKYYLSEWVDVIDGLNRWVIVPFDGAALDEFFAGRRTLRDIYQSQPIVYFHDYQLEFKPERVLKVQQDQFPVDYLPGLDSYYSESAYTQFAANFRLGRQRAGPPEDGASQ